MYDSCKMHKVPFCKYDCSNFMHTGPRFGKFSFFFYFIRTTDSKSLHLVVVRVRLVRVLYRCVRIFKEFLCGSNKHIKKMMRRERR